MASRSKSSPPSSTKTRLLVPRVEAEKKIQARINEGEKLLESKIRNFQELENFDDKYNTWTDYNKELLNRLFDSNAVSKEYSAAIGGVTRINPSFAERINYRKNEVRSKLGKLKSISQRLELYSEPDKDTVSLNQPSVIERGNHVFLVHGHNKEAMETVARFLEKLKLKVTILHEQPDKGMTIIEKFETYASADYAVVLLTDDDIGAIKTKQNDLKPRARQNVILELGFFLGKLGRSNVCALRKEDVEIPSDLSGVLYIPLDNDGIWRFNLAKEIKASGIEVDMNMV